MKKIKLNVFVSLLTTSSQEWLSLEGDKFSFNLPFSLDFTGDLKSSEVIVLDASYPNETAVLIEKELELIDPLKSKLVILNYFSTFSHSSDLRKIDVSKFERFDLDPSQVLPEDFLGVLHKCYEKLNNANP